jgi:tetratricopeptide (TPR) repeat protein
MATSERTAVRIMASPWSYGHDGFVTSDRDRAKASAGSLAVSHEVSSTKSREVSSTNGEPSAPVARAGGEEGADMTAAFGQRIRERRVRAGLSQTQLAGEDMSASYISLIEAGKRQPSPEAMRILAHRLGCRAEDLEGPDDSAALHVDLELAYARLALGHGEAVSARERLETLLSTGALSPRVEDDVRWLLADALDKSNDLVGAATVIYPVYERALDRRTHLPLAGVSLRLCGYYLRSGDLHAAVRVGERGLVGVQDLGLTGSDEHLRLAATVMWAFYELGDLTHCLAWAENVLTLTGERAAEPGKAAIYWNAALVAEAQGRVDTALNLCERALAVLSEQGSDRNLPRLSVQTAYLMMRADVDRAAQAAAVLDKVLPELEDLGGPIDLAVWGSRRALAALLLGDPATAERLARQALLHLSAHPDTEAAETLVTLGDALVAQGRLDEAQGHYLGAGEVLRKLRVSRQVAALWREIAERHLLAGQQDEALTCLREALGAAGVQAGVEAARVAFGLRPPAPATPAPPVVTPPDLQLLTRTSPPRAAD